MFRRRRERAPATDPLEGLHAPWRARVEDLIASRVRFGSLVASAPSGPVRDRLAALIPDVDEAVRLAAAIARRAQAAAEAADSLGAERATAELKEARRRLEQLRGHERADVAQLEWEVERLATHRAAVNRALNAVDDAEERIERLGLRLRTAVAEAAALVVRPARDDELDRLDRELRDVHDSLAALSAALADLDQ